MKSTAFLLAAATVALASPASAVTLVNTLEVANGVDLSTDQGAGVNGNRLGGFGSDLIYDAASDSYFGMTDRGPGGGLLDYAPRIQQFRLTTAANGAVSNFQLLSTIVFRQADGVATFNGQNPLLQTGSVGNLSNSFDPEGLVRLPNGNFLVSDEYGPSVYEFNASGVFQRAFTTPSNLIPRDGANVDYVGDRTIIDTGRQDNRGFEGLTLSTDGTKAYAIMQDPLVNEGRGDQGRRSPNLRIVEFDVASGTSTAQYAYQLESFTNINGRLPSDPFVENNQGRSIGVSAIIALPEAGKFLVIERDNRGFGVDPSVAFLPVGTKRVYLIDIDGATDISAVSLAGSNALPAGVVPVEKSLYLDVQAALEAAGMPVGEKLEGLTFGPTHGGIGRSLIAITDNDFSVTQTGAGDQFDVCSPGAGSGVITEIPLDGLCPTGQTTVPTYIYAFSLNGNDSLALGLGAVPEPSTWAMMIVGFGVIGSAMRRSRRRVSVSFG